MNNARRKEIDKALALVSEARGILEDVLSEEQSALDNLPDSFRDGARGESMETAISALEDAVSSLENVESELETAKE